MNSACEYLPFLLFQHSLRFSTFVSFLLRVVALYVVLTVDHLTVVPYNWIPLWEERKTILYVDNHTVKIANGMSCKPERASCG